MMYVLLLVSIGCLLKGYPYIGIGGLVAWGTVKLTLSVAQQGVETGSQDNAVGNKASGCFWYGSAWGLAILGLIVAVSVFGKFADMGR